MKKTLVLIILDGWGYRLETEYNAIAQANTPTWDNLWQQHPHALLSASSEMVGLPANQMGNSEVGHLHMGAGRIVPQTLLRINQGIAQGVFNDNLALQAMVAQTRKTALTQQKKPRIHLIGLLSPGGVHSHIDHIAAMADFIDAQQIGACHIHGILDGRDVPPQSALASLQSLDAHIASHRATRIVSVVGRYYAMDRDQRWERTEKAYDLFTQAHADYHAKTISEAIDMAYARGETDEFIQPTVIQSVSDKPMMIEDDDIVIVMNFRADRARQIVQAFQLPAFEGFQRACTRKIAHFLTLTEYQKDLPVSVLFPPTELTQVLGECIADQAYRQLRLAETEKYAHVTFFFNGGRETPFPGEKRVLVPSPAVATYDLQPEMHAMEVTDQLIAAIESQEYALIVCNYANADMVGHTGNFSATITAIETLDLCLKRIEKTLETYQAIALITADHGNAECLFDETTQQPHTAHTQSPVPCLCVAPGRSITSSKESGYLYDIAPTVLQLLDIAQPLEMTGTPLFQVQAGEM